MAKLTIEQNFDMLEEILQKMESGNVSLEESFKLYNDGLKLVKTCNSQIEKIEKQMIILRGEEENSEND